MAVSEEWLGEYVAVCGYSWQHSRRHRHHACSELLDHVGKHRCYCGVTTHQVSLRPAHERASTEN